MSFATWSIKRSTNDAGSETGELDVVIICSRVKPGSSSSDATTFPLIALLSDAVAVNISAGTKGSLQDALAALFWIRTFKNDS